MNACLQPTEPRGASRRPPLAPGQLPSSVEAAIWRGSDLGASSAPTVASGHDDLDALLPGGGWPSRSLTELLQPQPALTEWRLLAPAMRATSAAGKEIVVIGPPKSPHLPGLRDEGIDERHVIWIHAATPAERLWTTEQLIKANAAGMVVAWLPQARQEQIRRLQVCALGCDCPVFLCRPASVARESSAAPLRLQVTYGVDWELHVHILKRRGSTHDGMVRLPSVPRGLAPLLTPRLAKPSALLAAARRQPPVVQEELTHAVGRPSAGNRPERIAAH
ncbi:translesion DNA synthesis-associated protein ImuA [Variovorax sp. LjRoot84]|uniref:translesion DNA synthesis-associated protein ImuA n=1 Tax=Variovorax sp. LjRoot84 TaxID=3342340 RepID=UPI003ED02EA9